MLGWPDEWTMRRYNGCNEPCDFLIGPCACGAMHDADEEWVQRALEHYVATIVYKPEAPEYGPPSNLVVLTAPPGSPVGDAVCWAAFAVIVGRPRCRAPLSAECS